MGNEPISPDELRILLCHLLAGAAGGDEARWDCTIGELTAVNMTFSPTSNWALALGRGTAADKRAIDKAVEVVRQAHPYLRW